MTVSLSLCAFVTRVCDDIIVKDTGLLCVGSGAQRVAAVRLEAVEGDFKRVAERVVIEAASQRSVTKTPVQRQYQYQYRHQWISKHVLLHNDKWPALILLQ